VIQFSPLSLVVVIATREESHQHQVFVEAAVQSCRTPQRSQENGSCHGHQQHLHRLQVKYSEFLFWYSLIPLLWFLFFCLVGPSLFMRPPVQRGGVSGGHVCHGDACDHDQQPEASSHRLGIPRLFC